MKRIASLVSLLLVLVVLPVVIAHAADETLTNASITDLQKLGFGDAVIIQKIKASHSNFDTSTDGLKQLKAAGISDTVIAAMIEAGTPATPAPGVPPPPAPPGDVNDPLAAHDPGVWLYQENNGQKTMTKIEPSLFGEVKSGVAVFAIYGQTSKARSVMNGAHAKLQLNVPRPVFYFYFEKTQSGLSDNSTSATSPDDFVLMKMEVKEKKDERSVVIGKVGLYGGGSHAGYDSKAIYGTDYEKINTGVYKVTPGEDLADGEYCILSAGTGATVGFGYAAGGPRRGFCFGISGGGGSSKK